VLLDSIVYLEVTPLNTPWVCLAFTQLVLDIWLGNSTEHAIGLSGFHRNLVAPISHMIWYVDCRFDLQTLLSLLIIPTG
jgi:hypothetical protein